MGWLILVAYLLLGLVSWRVLYVATWDLERRRRNPDHAFVATMSGFLGLMLGPGGTIGVGFWRLLGRRILAPTPSERREERERSELERLRETDRRRREENAALRRLAEDNQLPLPDEVLS